MSKKEATNQESTDFYTINSLTDEDMSNLDSVFTLAIQNLASTGKKTEIAATLNLQNKLFKTLHEVNTYNSIREKEKEKKDS